jgi:hypothetical protein
LKFERCKTCKQLYYLVKPIFHENSQNFDELLQSGARHDFLKNGAICPSGAKSYLLGFFKKTSMVLYAKTLHFGKFEHFEHFFCILMANYLVVLVFF